MANNFFISYDLDSPGQNYPKVEAAIKALGTAVKVHLSVYYLKTTLGGLDVHDRVRKATDANDRLLVIEASNAWFSNAIPPAKEIIAQQWGA